MRRIQIKDASATLPALKQSEVISKSYEFTLITPMFGGDEDSFVINKKTPIRSQSIKGQLRFWWRTMQGFTSRDELLKAETKIWGGSLSEKKLKSEVKVSVTDFRNLEVTPIKKERPWTEPNILSSYVLFPIFNNKDVQNPSLLSKATFSLSLTYPREHEKAAINSLLLWALFGGVGARTRRGCGSVYSEELLKDRGITSIADVKKFIDDVGCGNVAELPYARIKGAKLFYSSAKGSVKELLKKYGDYRQDRKPPQVGENHPGRSYWPEPDAIRQLILPKSILNSPKNLHKPEHPDEIWFPRAAFGLPVITHFNTSNNGKDDPRDNIKLEPAEKIGGRHAERWPSPYFIKQLKLQNELFNVMFVLNQKFPSSLILNGVPVPPSGLPSNTKGKDMNVNPNKPEYRLNNRTITKALADALGMEEA